MQSDPVPKLVALLRTHAARLDARVLGEMDANPFGDDLDEDFTTAALERLEG